MDPSSSPRDLPRLIFGILFIGLLLTTSFWVLKPFLLPLVWATMIAVATWPLLLGVERWLRNSRGLAVLVMSVGLLLLLILPLALAVTTILQNTEVMKAWFEQLSAAGLPQPPVWVGNLPLIGEKVAAMWSQAATAGPEGLSARLMPYANRLLGWLVANAGGVGVIFLQFLLTLVLTAILYVKGEIAATGVRRFFHRLAGEQGEEAVILAGKAIRAVAIGIVVTALIQSLLGGIGLWLAGIPGVLLLTAVMFLLTIAQVGPFPVLIVAAAWLFWKGQMVWGIVLLVWTLVIGGIDNLIRPMLIRRGADLPMLLIFAGVLGGVVAFGVIGLFVGPVVLAVSYTLIKAWVNQDEIAESEESR